ncbi:MAG: replicative DNA helicase [Candidatus Pacebacteria bacterium]|nr:replicative DNA helicase [Candidatus Paceibacterota bacterium]MCF7862891.1 replicative DNA helicase [Candidatus Paceibacterota bacterium]
MNKMYKNSNDLRMPPQSIASEQAVLGSIMLRKDALLDIEDVVNADSFYAPKHKIIFQSMLDLSLKNEPIDLLSVANKLAEQKNIESVGGNQYLAELANSVPSSANIRHYAEIVQKKYILRSLIEASNHISEIAFEENDSNLDEVLDEAEKKIFGIVNSPKNQKYVNLKDALPEAFERIEKLSEHKGGLRGIPTGFKDLDNTLSGLQNSDLIILAARPSVGKTTLALDMARMSAIGHKKAVGIFSLEMSAQQLIDRMLSAESKVDAWKIRTGKGLHIEHDFGRIRDAMQRLSEAKIFIDDQAGNSITKMKAVARRWKAEKGLDFIIVDYLQLMTTSKNYDSMVNQVTEISRSLKALAKELDVPVLALSQLNRAVESRGGKPRLSDLRDSGCVTGDTLIQRADTGERIPIKELVGQQNIPVISLSGEYELRPMLASKFFSNGKKEIFELKMRSGKTIKASANHKFYTMDGWQRLDALDESDRIATPRFIQATSPISNLCKEELILLAHLLGDGCVLPRQPIHYTSADEKNIKAVEDASEKLFGIKARRIRQKNWWHTYLPSPYRLTKNKHHPITDWYTELGIQAVRSYEKKIPKAVFASDSMSIQLFLHHLWATDGNISRKILAGRKTSASIYYATSSKELAKGVQHLLLRLGIWSNIREVTQGKYRPMFNVYVQSTPMQKKFLDLVGSYGSRGKIVSQLKKALEAIAPIPNTDTIPKEVWQLFVAPEKEKANMSWRDVSENLNISYNGSALVTRGVSRERLAKVATVLQSKSLVHLAESDIYWDEITSITPLGKEEVFDATVPGAHNFVAEDIIIHNSIEQDADVVMFIHREDKGKDESEKTNIAEILIEKHRNGPTGKVELYFDEKTTTFLNLDKSSINEFSATQISNLDEF